jgi:GNAT superfamily N-acetyltransferase
MTASEHLSGLQFEHFTNNDNHVLAAYAGNPHAEDAAERKRVGDIRWHKETGVIDSLYIKPSHRRQGVATALYHATSQYGPPAQHSDARSEEGDAWAAKVGGHVPPLRERVAYTS